MSAYQNDSKVQNEIVTLRGEACLVVTRKPKFHHGGTEARRRAGPESSRRFPQMNADRKSQSKTFETRRNGVNGGKQDLELQDTKEYERQVARFLRSDLGTIKRR
jgi:hypothetical protein